MRQNKPDSESLYLQDLFWTHGAQSNLFTVEEQELFQLTRLSSDGFGKTGISLGFYELHLTQQLIRSHKALNKWPDVVRFVELGTLTGTSALVIASALQVESAAKQAHLYTFELDKEHARAAENVFEKWNSIQKKAKSPKAEIHIMQGSALDELKKIESLGPLQGVFIDANKNAYPDYLDWSEKNLQKGALILADNVYLSGAVFESKLDSTDDVVKSDTIFSPKQVQNMRTFNSRLADVQKFQSFILPTKEGLYVAEKVF